MQVERKAFQEDGELGSRPRDGKVCDFPLCFLGHCPFPWWVGQPFGSFPGMILES